MNKRSNRNSNPGGGAAGFSSDNRRGRSRRGRVRRRMRRICFLCICMAAIAALLFFPTHEHPNVSTQGDAESDLPSYLQERPADSAINIVNPPEGGRYEDNGLTDAMSETGGNSDSAGTPWYLLLVNRTHPLPDGWQEALTLTELDNGQSVDSRIYPSLQAMFEAMRSDGVYPIVASGFRTAEKQQSLMNEKIASFESQGYSAEQAKNEAEKWVAVPGTSEHQLGSAVDINADGIHSAGYQVYEWLDKHAHEYGFIRRYPEDKTEITGISNEPWHYRYVGEEAAAEIHRRGICLEEYLDAVSAAP